MRKNIKVCALIVLCMTFLIVFNACATQYRLHNDESEISKISIISLQKQKKEVIQNEIVEIKDIDSFMKDFRKVKTTVMFGSPQSPLPDEDIVMAIKIEYNNGEYEIINEHGAAHGNNTELNMYVGLICWIRNNTKL